MKAAPRHLDSAQIMARFGITRQTLYRWMSDADMGLPKPFRIRNRYYFQESAIEAWELARGKACVAEPETVCGFPVASNVIRTYPEFVAAMTLRRKELGITCMEVDLMAGMQESYTSKLENWPKPHGRGMGPEIFPLWLGGLKCGVVLVDLPRRPKKGKLASAVDAEAAA